ncbi:AraC family transcriptional regulator [Pantoea sp. FN0305]|uniref:AraC family transcriptional regulator n=1 Tax=Pantoea sp. FN0305 TaxID=3418559 RepID=UPI003CEA49CC
MMSAIQQQICQSLQVLAPQEGYTASLLEEVRFMRADQPIERTPVLYEPSIIIVCQGRKRGYLADRIWHYDAQQFLVLSVPLPFSSETEATPEEPMLAVAVKLNLALATELLMLVGESGKQLVSAPEGMVSTPLDAPLLDVLHRLLKALQSPLETRALGASLLRELYFRVLMSEQGGAIRAALACQGHFGRIARALNHIHQQWQSPLNVPMLAEKAGMSVPRFHIHFKAITHTSPIQYIKSVRLHQARLMMIRSNLPAAKTALQVGYESASQFNREFRRFFGRSPGDETRRMKQALALLPPAELERQAISH